jgi:hypothetical protein
LIVTVPVLESAAPSLTLKVSVTVPRNPGAGVYTKFGAVPVNVPLAGVLRIVQVSSSLSGSVAARLNVKGSVLATV